MVRSCHQMITVRLSETGNIHMYIKHLLPLVGGDSVTWLYSGLWLVQSNIHTSNIFHRLLVTFSNHSNMITTTTTTTYDWPRLYICFLLTFFVTFVVHQRGIDMYFLEVESLSIYEISEVSKVSVYALRKLVFLKRFYKVFPDKLFNDLKIWNHIWCSHGLQYS